MAEEQKQTAKILIADDDPDFLITLESKLYFAGYKVVKAECGQAALQAAKDEQPDLIILDIKMPDMDGMSVAVALKKDEATKDIPVIFLTGLQTEEDERKMLKERSDPVSNMIFSKILNSTEFLDWIKSLIEKGKP